MGTLEAQQAIARLEEIQDLLQSARVNQEQVLESVTSMAPRVAELQMGGVKNGPP